MSIETNLKTAMKWIKRLIKRSPGDTSPRENSLRKRERVRNITKDVLKTYQKTFRDLARYDRGEKIFDPTSR